MGLHVNSQRFSISRVERQVWGSPPAWTLKTQGLPVSSSVTKGFGLRLIHQILSAGPEAHLNFPVPVDAPCGEHLAGWHTFWNAEFLFEDEESLLTGQLKIHHTCIWKLCVALDSFLAWKRFHFAGFPSILYLWISKEVQAAASSDKDPLDILTGPGVLLSCRKVLSSLAFSVSWGLCQQG